jgi:hypothetical protein
LSFSKEGKTRQLAEQAGKGVVTGDGRMIAEGANPQLKGSAIALRAPHRLHLHMRRVQYVMAGLDLA